MAQRRRTRQPVDANGDLIASDLERTFDTLWRQLDGPELVPEYEFAPPRIAIEIDGGTYNGGRHTTGNGYRDDCIKLNAAQLRGWFVFRLTSDMLRDDPDQHLAPIIAKIADLMDEGDE